MKKATTADILGLNRRPRIPTRWASHHRELCVQRDALAGIEAPRIEAERTDDVADAGSMELDANLELTTHRATRETLGEVLAAIERIEKGTFGNCELTGIPIEAERLEATPWARYSLAGQAEFERTVGNNHARIGDRQDDLFREVTEPEPEEEAEEPKEKVAA